MLSIFFQNILEHTELKYKKIYKNKNIKYVKQKQEKLEIGICILLLKHVTKIIKLLILI